MDVLGNRTLGRTSCRLVIRIVQRHVARVAINIVTLSPERNGSASERVEEGWILLKEHWQ